MGKAATGLQVAQYLLGYLLPGEPLIQDLHFQYVIQSLAWMTLATVGLVSTTNVITDPD